MPPEALLDSDSMEGGPGLRLSVVAAIASSRECTIALREGSIDESKFLDLFSMLDFASCTLSIIDNLAFQISSIEWDTVRLRLHCTEY
jgi:hypothetical protein